MTMGINSASDLSVALKTAVSEPTGFLALALIVLSGLTPKLVDSRRDNPSLGYKLFSHTGRGPRRSRVERLRELIPSMFLRKQAHK